MVAPRRLAVGCFVLGLALAATARADDDAGDGPGPAGAEGVSVEARATARQRMDAGHARFKARDYAGALEDYREADRIMGVPTTRLGIARALVALGRLVEAREVVARLLAAPVSSSEPPAFERAREKARALSSELVARIPTLTVKLPEPPPVGVRVKVDGRLLAPDLVGAPTRFDPGPHVVEVTAPGHARFGAELPLAEGANETVTAILEAREGAEADGAGESDGDSEQTTRDDAARGEAGAHRTASRTVSGSVGRVWSGVGVGLGATGVLLGGLAGVMTFVKVSQLEGACPAGRCPETERAAYASMERWATTADVALPVGVVLLGAGVVGLVVTGAGPDAVRPEDSVARGRGESPGTVRLSLGAGSFTVEGAF